MNAEQAKALTAITAATNRAEEERENLRWQDQCNAAAQEYFPGVLKELYINIEQAAKFEEDYIEHDLSRYDCCNELYELLRVVLEDDGYSVMSPSNDPSDFENKETIHVSWAENRSECD